MRFRSSIQRIFIIALVCMAVLHAFRSYESNRYSGKADDTIDQWEMRFVKLKEALPVDNGSVGYLADFDIDGIEYNIADQEAEYILAQYTMAPVVLVRNTNYEWIIGNLSAQAYKAWLALNRGEYEVTGFGNDLYLIHKNRP